MSKRDAGICTAIVSLLTFVIGIAIAPNLIKWQREREIASVAVWEGTEGKISFDPNPSSQGKNKISSGPIVISIEKDKKMPEGEWVVKVMGEKARQIEKELAAKGAILLATVWDDHEFGIFCIEIRYRESRFFNLGMNAEPWGRVTIINQKDGKVLVDNQCTPLWLPNLREKTKLRINFTPNESKEVKEYWAYIEKEEQLLKGPPVSIAIWQAEGGEKQ